MRYIEQPTYTETNVIPQSKAKFPAVTVCPTMENPLRKTALERHNISSFASYMGLSTKTAINWSSNDSNVSEQELFNQLTFTLDEIIVEGVLNYIDKNSFEPQTFVFTH